MIFAASLSSVLDPSFSSKLEDIREIFKGAFLGNIEENSSREINKTCLTIFPMANSGGYWFNCNLTHYPLVALPGDYFQNLLQKILVHLRSRISF